MRSITHAAAMLLTISAAMLLTQAAATDQLCGMAWSGHPYYVLIDNANRDWTAKSLLAHAALYDRIA